MNDYYIAHSGVKRKSGRYPWGSGKHPYQDEPWFKGWAEDHKSGMSDAQIAKKYGMTINEMRYKYSYGKDAEQAALVAKVKSLREDKQMSISAIAKKMGVSEGNVRNWLEPMYEERRRKTQEIVEVLSDYVDKKKYIDVGKGVAETMGHNRTKVDAAVEIMKDMGYNVYTMKYVQPSNDKQRTTIKVLAAPEVTKRECYENLDKIDLPYPVHVQENGKTAANIYFPTSVDSKRIKVIYGDEKSPEGGYGTDRDGLIEIRRGVQDLSMGDNKYCQVRIAVDGTHYLKGMAVYSDNLPEGVDIVFNTNKKKGTPLMSSNPKDKQILKPMEKDNLTGEVDRDNPFGAQIAQQYTYKDKNGKEQVSAINAVNEEGKWGDWSSAKTLASQVLSKQSVDVAKRQLDLDKAKREKEFSEIMAVTNPAVKEKLLRDFADECDLAAVHLKAAALPRQSVKVIIPIPSLKDNEIYAPAYKDGEKIALIRYPHGGKFEIPELIVNNQNKEGKRVLGGDTYTAVGINKHVADILSGADFDGDTVLTIPNDKKFIQSQRPLKELEGFDAKERYPYHEGMKVMTKRNTQTEMGKITNLITDMQLSGAATDAELARAIRHSQVVIDAEKHKLDYKASEIDNNIAELKEKYQSGKNSGASTLISRSSSQMNVPERNPNLKYIIDKNTGEKIFQYTGRSKSYYTDAQGNTRYRYLYPNQEGYNSDPKALLTEQSTKMYEAKDAYKLSSGTKMEAAYADYANAMKAMGDKARLESTKTTSIPYDAKAAEIYATEVESIKNKINDAAMRAPLSRRAEMAARVIIDSKVKSNPDIYTKDESGKKALKKLRKQVVAQQRALYGQKVKCYITDREWQAIQAGAVRKTTLSRLLNYAEPDRVRELATPKASTLPTMSQSDINVAKAMINSGYTLQQIAESLNVSPSTISKYTK